MEVEIGSSGAKGGQLELEAQGYSLTRRLEFELDLTRSEDELWDALKSQCRGHIKKALKMGIVLRDCSDAQGIDALRRLQGESSQRIVARGGRDITRKNNGKGDPLQVLFDQGQARLCCAEVEGQIESAGLFTQFNGHVYYALSGHSRKALHVQAPSLMLWESIKRYRAEGARAFNLGGCLATAVEESSSEHGVYMYKKAFGTKAVECASGRKVLRATTYRLVKLLKQATGR
jgi:lipid II:glycine glycyltransferase (peptidoglycan interpeptide bridge formation enzyme)